MHKYYWNFQQTTFSGFEPKSQNLKKGGTVYLVKIYIKSNKIQIDHCDNNIGKFMGLNVHQTFLPKHRMVSREPFLTNARFEEVIFYYSPLAE